MNTKRSLIPAAAAGCLFVVSGAAADFRGASLELLEDDGPGGYWTWRVYIDFDDPDDTLLSIGGIPGLASLTFESNAVQFARGGFLRAQLSRATKFLISRFPLFN